MTETEQETEREAKRIARAVEGTLTDQPFLELCDPAFDNALETEAGRTAYRKDSHRRIAKQLKAEKIAERVERILTK